MIYKIETKDKIKPYKVFEFEDIYVRYWRNYSSCLDFDDLEAFRLGSFPVSPYSIILIFIVKIIYN